nr:cell wall-binding repeat-containing protein [Bacillus sp. NTK071]
MILNREDGQVGYIETEKDKKGDAKLVKKLKAGIYYVKFTDNDEENEAYRFKISTSTSSTVTRLEGPNRYDTAVAISKKGWSTSNTVILTTGINFPDALAGAPLAYKENAPILLTQQNKLTEVTKTELKRLKAKKVIILGSDDVVSKSINTTIKGMGISTERIGGKDRYETAALIAKKLYSSKAVLAYGLNFPDALAIAPYAARNGIPILLTKTDSLPTYTKTALKGKSSAIIVGSSDVVSKKVESSLSVSSVKRYGGDNRYDTAKLIIENLKLGTNSAYVATGLNFPDALAGSALAAKHNAPILLVNGNKMPDSTKSLISKYKSFTLLGGSDVVGNEIKKILE